MDIPDSVPSLKELAKMDEDLGPYCHWPVGARTCRNKILKSDIKERDELIRQLRSLIQPAKRPDTTSDIKTILADISKWILCKRAHRDSNSTAIFRNWSEDLSNLEVVRQGPTTKDVRKMLEIKDDNKLSCEGITRAGTRCTRCISNEKRECADAIIEAITEARSSSSTTRDNVLVLAQLLMCENLHQSQAAKKSEEWFAKIQELFPTAGVAPKQSSTSTFRRPSTVDSISNQSTPSSISSRTHSRAYSTPPTSPPSQRRDNRTVTPLVTPTNSKNTKTIGAISIDQPLRARQTRSTNYESKQRLPPAFEPFRCKSNQQILNDLYNTMTNPISSQAERSGYVYAFKRPGGHLIKVGYTNNVGRRLGEWARDCKQDIIEVHHISVPHAFRVESLVHATLYQERRRENLIGGRCNGGKGCSTVHKEWLEVTESRVRDVLDAWKHWIDSMPYENKELKPEWLTYIKNIRKKQQLDLIDPWRAWLQMPVNVKITKMKTELADDKTNASNAIKKEEKPILNSAKIKSEVDNKATVDLQELRELSRGLVESLIKIKNETTEEQPLSRYPARPHRSKDPFIPLALTATPVAA